MSSGSFGQEPSPECACQVAIALDVDLAGVLDAFARLRVSCPVLRDLCVPDGDWSAFRDWHLADVDNGAAHRLALLLALQGGYLPQVLSALHRFLFDGNRLRPDVRKQYREGLRERWMDDDDDDATERHERFKKTFLGRIVELHIAEWLVENGWSVTALEATRPQSEQGPDIEAIIGEEEHVFEVKVVGMSNADFEMITRAMNDQPRSKGSNSDAALNYLFFRAYEAAKQLEKLEVRGTAVIVFDNTAWWNLEWLHNQRRIDLAHPTFARNAGADWDRFIQRQQHKYPNILNDLADVIGNLRSIWVTRRTNEYRYQLMLPELKRV